MGDSDSDKLYHNDHSPNMALHLDFWVFHLTCNPDYPIAFLRLNTSHFSYQSIFFYIPLGLVIEWQRLEVISWVRRFNLLVFTLILCSQVLKWIQYLAQVNLKNVILNHLRSKYNSWNDKVIQTHQSSQTLKTIVNWCVYSP